MQMDHTVRLLVLLSSLCGRVCHVQLRRLYSNSPPATAAQIAAVPVINISTDQLG